MDEMCVAVSRILRPHGVRGEVKIALEIGDAGWFSQLDHVFVAPVGGKRFETHIRDVRGSSPYWIVKLDGIDDRDSADALRGAEILAEREDLPELTGLEEAGSLLIGFEVWNITGEVIGRVEGLMRMPLQDVLQISTPGGEVLVPLVPAFVKRVDLEEARIYLEPIEGLLEP